MAEKGRFRLECAAWKARKGDLTAVGDGGSLHTVYVCGAVDEPRAGVLRAGVRRFAWWQVVSV